MTKDTDFDFSLDPDDEGDAEDQDFAVEWADMGLGEPDGSTSGVATDETVEAGASREVSELLSGFQARARAENDRYQQATDTEYWFAACFFSLDQRDEFLVKAGLYDKLRDQYLDGRLLAKKMGITLSPHNTQAPKTKQDPKLNLLT